jgi:hypothetical protein
LSGWFAACARDPVDSACPDVRVGELVVSEIRGDQTGTTDTIGQWIELYNASGRQLDLSGLTVKLRKIDGGSEAHIIVRAPALTVDAGAYVVLGAYTGTLPPYADYGYLLDFSSNLYAAAAIELEACGVLIDRAVYRLLPGQGTWAFDGNQTPDATANDDEGAWCADSAGVGSPGTPRERNNPCP